MTYVVWKLELSHRFTWINNEMLFGRNIIGVRSKLNSDKETKAVSTSKTRLRSLNTKTPKVILETLKPTVKKDYAYQCWIIQREYYEKWRQSPSKVGDPVQNWQSDKSLHFHFSYLAEDFWKRNLICVVFDDLEFKQGWV